MARARSRSSADIAGASDSEGAPRASIIVDRHRKRSVVPVKRDRGLNALAHHDGRLIAAGSEVVDRVGAVDAGPPRLVDDDRAVDGADRMREMIDALLKYSRLDRDGDEFEPVDCAVVLDEAMGNLQIAIEENDAEITSDSLPTVMGDKQQLVQLFQNLLDICHHVRRR